MPRPYLQDSSDVEGRGGGLYAEAVTQTVSGEAAAYTVTFTVDQAFLDSAVYPVYVDPTTTNFPNQCSCSTNDTFASER
jgi:hypothetical protein